MKRVIALLCVGLILISVAGCGSDKNKLAGAWYREGSSDPYIILYSDGTWQQSGRYGTGTWNVVDGYLKLTDFYGSTERYRFEVNGNELTVYGSGGNSAVLHKGK